jgi:hypothetical protein
MISFANKNRIWICGIADFFGMIILIVTPVLFGDPGDFTNLFTTHLTFFIFGILPFSMFVGWRGMKDAAKLLNGNHVFFHVPIEGFSWGFAASMLMWIVGYFYEVFAAGGQFDEVIGQPTNLMAWLKILMIVNSFSFVAGVIGAIIATLIHLLNEFLISLEFHN